MSLVLVATVAAVTSSPAWAAPVASPAPDAHTTTRSIALPGAPAEGGVGMDFIAYDRAHGRVWVPAGNTGRVDVIDVATSQVTAIGGFATKEVERNGRKRTVGPSSVAIGDGVVYVGSRGDDSICALDAVSLAKGPCVKLDSMPDAVAVVRSAKEVWVTTQANHSIVVLDTATPGALPIKTTFALAGSPECLAVDGGRGIVYTNLEDKDRTVAIDVKTRQVTHTWQPGCGGEGPRGLALDEKLDFLFVACTTRVQLLDAGHDGKLLGAVDVGAGVDTIDYVAGRHELFAAARAGKLVIARLDPHGALTPVATVDTPSGARNAVATEKGVVYLTSGREGAILVVERR